MSYCRSKETFLYFHFDSVDKLEELRKFLTDSYSVKAIVYPSGNVSDRQFEITREGILKNTYVINLGEWILMTILGGITLICSDYTFKKNFTIIREKSK